MRNEIARLTANVEGASYAVCQLPLRDGQFALDGEPFTANRKWFSADSWLVRKDGDEYASAMTNDEFVEFVGHEQYAALQEAK